MFSDFYRRHPIATWVFGIGAALVLIWALFGRATASASSEGQYVVSTPGPSPDAALAASTQLESARIAAQADAKRSDNELQYQAAALAVQSTLGQQQLLNDDRESERQYNANVYNIATGERISIATIQSQTDQAGMVAAIERARIAEEGATQRAQIGANLATTQALTNSQVAIAQTQASVAKKQSNNGLLGGILKIFSDVRLKTDLQFEGVDRLGIPVYSYRYTAQAFALDARTPRGVQRGYLAQDVLATKYAHAVGTRKGFLTVDYGAINGR